jgi:hypothetical protein
LQRLRGDGGWRISPAPERAAARLRPLQAALLTEAAFSMAREEAIIFFDKLGFGWVIDPRVLKDVKLSILKEEELPSRSLIEIIDNILSEKPVM